MILEATYSVLMWGIFKIGNIKTVKTPSYFKLEGKVSLFFKKAYVYYYQNQTNYIYFEKSGKKKRQRRWVFYLGQILYHQNYNSTLVLGKCIGKIVKKTKNGFICYRFSKGDVKEACVKIKNIGNYTIPQEIKLYGNFPTIYIKLRSYKILN